MTLVKKPPPSPAPKLTRPLARRFSRSSMEKGFWLKAASRARMAPPPPFRDTVGAGSRGMALFEYKERRSARFLENGERSVDSLSASILWIDLNRQLLPRLRKLGVIASRHLRGKTGDGSAGGRSTRPSRAEQKGDRLTKPTLGFLVPPLAVF